jgi:DNA-binding SARP family transcriptional activator/LysM repeat protein
VNPTTTTAAETLTRRRDTGSERAKLFGFCALMVAAGIGLEIIAGPPRLPASIPSAAEIVELLTGSTLPVAPLLLMLVDVAWLLWFWIVGSLCLELLLVIADLLAGSAGWVCSLRRLADRLSVPLVRNAVAAAFAVQVLSRGVPIAAAQTLPPAQQTLVSDASAVADGPDRADPAADATYLVQPGDTLWSIAERAYGTGKAYRQIIDANVNCRMDDGQVFSARGVIQPGWRVRVPGASWQIPDAGGLRWYTVRPGDTLSSIAESALGVEDRWTELFDLNRDASTPDGQHILVDPNAIWPGLRLQLPPAEDSAQSSSGEDAAPDPQPDPSPDLPPVDLEVATSGPTQPEVATDRAPVASTQQADDSESPETDQPPLERTQHLVYPVVLQGADSVDPEVDTDGTAVPPGAASVGDAEVTIPKTPVQGGVPVIPLAIGGLGLAVAGLTYGARRFRRLRPLPQEPETEVVVEGGFAEAQLAHDLTRGLHGVGFDPVGGLVAQLQDVLNEYNLADAGVMAVRHGRSSTTLTLRCGLAEQPLLIDLAPVFADKLDAEVQAWVSTDQDVHLRFSRLRKTRLLPTAASELDGPWLVPLGVLFDRQVFSVEWTSLGHLLVVSLPGHGADTILTSLVATLTARRSPEQLRVWLLAPSRSLPAPVFDLPHLVRVVDPGDESALGAAVDALRAELDWRADHPGQPDLVVVVSELAILGERAASFALLASQAALRGVRFVSASTSPEEVLVSALAGVFSTRMVLRMQAEEASVALLGVADATLLGGGGRLLLRLDGREPVELYGYQVTPEHLERLVKVMRSAYSPPPTTSPAATGGAESVPASRQPPGPVPERAEGDDPPPALHLADESAIEPAIDPSVESSVETPSGAPSLPTSTDLLGAASASTERAINVTCFGSPRVVCAGQPVWPKFAAGDAKPWEFLLYLACQAQEGVSRDTAVEALWPDDEFPEEAPHRFRQLRYRLRRMLTAVPGARRTDGISADRAVLRLDPGIVYSDAHEFQTLVHSVRTNPGADAQDRLERARALYVGDLLDGPDARRYAWVTERDRSGVTLREHFRRLFVQTSILLAELYVASAATDAAVAMYRELTEMDPADERHWVALFRLHAERRDRVALVREEQRLRGALRELAEDADTASDLPVDEPSRETRAEYERLLASLRGREPASA